MICDNVVCGTYRCIIFNVNACEKLENPSAERSNCMLEVALKKMAISSIQKGT